MVYSLTYRRPRRVEPSSNRESYGSEEGKSSMLSGHSGVSAGIPDALAFDRIIDGGTCPPCTVRDFMNYLLYIERAPENLQFYLWLRDYVKRFEKASTPDIALAPRWTEVMQESALEEARAKRKPSKVAGPSASSTGGTVTSIFKGTDFAPGSKVRTQEPFNPFSDPPTMSEKPGSPQKRNPFNSTFNSHESSMLQESSLLTRSAESYQTSASEAFSGAGLKQPFTIQPFREEVNRVIATYVVKDSPRELNLSSPERYALLKALQYTTHPTAFSKIAATTESSLRRQAHPNFIRWTICNGNRPRVIFARGLGIVTIILGLLMALLITMSSVSRGYRALGAVLWVAGTATFIAAYKGMCVVLHGLHHRHLRPWELFEDPEMEMAQDEFDHFPNNAKSYEDEPWVIKYQKRNIIRKIFDKEVWIQEPALRQIQDTIFLQALIAGGLAGLVLSAVFVVVPAGGFY